MQVIGENRAETPTVSIVIPCYNHGVFLGEAIESVLRWETGAIEIIVVDDGSTDDTPAVIARYPVVRGVRQRNAGLAAARNGGLRLCRGRYVMFLDADDLLLPAAVAHSVRLMDEHLDWAFVSGAFRYADKNAAPISGPIVARRAVDRYAALLRRNYIGMGATVLFRRSVLERVGGFDTTLAACEDWDLHLRIACRYPVGQHREVVALYRRHDTNMSRDAWLMLRTGLTALHRQRRFVRRDPTFRAAYRAGVRFLCQFYGLTEFVRGALVRLVAGRDRAAGLEQLLFLLRHAPRPLLRAIPLCLRRAVAAPFQAARAA
jgi:glycosyltransferase involved in cell wall biosynthesis